MTDPQQIKVNANLIPTVELTETRQNAAIAIQELEIQINTPNETQQQININAKPVEAPINTTSFKRTENSINEVMARSEQLEIEESATVSETSVPNLTQIEENKTLSIDENKNFSTNMTIAEPSNFNKLSQKYKELPNWRRLIG